MSLSYRARVFLLLSVVFVATSAGWSVWRYASHATEREAYEEVTARIAAQKGRIDSLETVLGGMEAELEREKRSLESAEERIRHWERRAVHGRLPTPQHRRYIASIERQNEVVDRHNAALGRMRELYAEYADLIERHNALVDSANAMQRRAVEEGYELPPTDLP